MSSRIRDIDLGRLAHLIELLAEDGRGVTVRPIKSGAQMGGIGSQREYAFDGWEVGWITGFGGDEIAVGATVDEAVEAAIAALEAESE